SPAPRRRRLHRGRLCQRLHDASHLLPRARLRPRRGDALGVGRRRARAGGRDLPRDQRPAERVRRDPHHRHRARHPRRHPARARLLPRFEWQATDRITGFAFYRAEYDSLSNVPSAVRTARPGLAPANSTLSGFGVGADWNATDNLLDPTRGWVGSATVEPVGGPLGGDVSLVRVVTEGRLYQPLVA